MNAPSSTSFPPSSSVGTMEERQCSILSSSDFTVAHYLNTALANQDDLPARMAELALQLQLQTQACHEDIGRLGAELQAILPRCHADVARIGVGLEGLQTDATQLLASIQVESDATHQSSLETLSTLHHLRANLLRTKEILTAAATWDATLQSLAPLLTEHDLPQAVQALSQLEQGEMALRGMPHVEDRQQALEQARTQVVALLQPQLAHALQNIPTRVAPLQQCALLYAQLKMTHVLQQEYVKHRPGALHKQWFSMAPGTSLVEWLPKWLDQVLKLIDEEKRLLLLIFGPEPIVLLQVVRECFRPILGSFQSRLESICSLKSGAAFKCELQEVCNIYQAVLKFLSVTYETIAGGWMDLAESGSLPSDLLSGYYHELFTVFGGIVAPFVSYQERLGELEGRYAASLLEAYRNEMKGLSAASIDDLQTSINELEKISKSIFPVTEAGMARFEVMNAGFGAADALETMDQVIGGFVEDLRGAVQRLSSEFIADNKTLAENFDDSNVYTSLNILKVAGSFQRRLRALETQARERLNVLGGRIVAQAAREEELKSTTGRRSGSAVMIPDALSPIEMDSALAHSILGESSEEKTNSASFILRQLGSDSGMLFRETQNKLADLQRACHCFVFDVCLSVPTQYLSGMSSLTVWKQSDALSDFASYGALPQQFITHVGEHVLALVQALEPFATEKASLDVANEVMQDARMVAIQPWKDLLIACGVVGTDDLIRSLMDGQGLTSYFSLNVSNHEDEDPTEMDDDEGEPEVAAFCNAWLDAVGVAVAGRLLERIMKIPSLSPSGSEQLKADLNYLINVFSALGIKGHPHPLLSHVASQLEDGTSVGGDRADPVVHAIGSMEERLTAMRG